MGILPSDYFGNPVLIHTLGSPLGEDRAEGTVVVEGAVDLEDCKHSHVLVCLEEVDDVLELVVFSEGGKVGEGERTAIVTLPLAKGTGELEGLVRVALLCCYAL